MIPYPYNMVDMGGIDLAEANGTIVEGLYDKIVEAVNACGDAVLYNWKFAGIEIAPQHTSILLGDPITINGAVQVTEQDLVTVPGINPEPPTGTLDISQNGIYDVRQYANVDVNVSTGGDEMPTGSVIFYAGLTAPVGYLHCNGDTYSIVDYADLAAFIESNYGAVNYFGGDGSTTFAVPDWRGEFFRAAGTNSHSGQGSGGSVGQHQDATLQIRLSANKSESNGQVQGNTSGWLTTENEDATELSPTHYWMNIHTSSSGPAPSDSQRYASRPTNTSLLVCIKI